MTSSASSAIRKASIGLAPQNVPPDMVSSAGRGASESDSGARVGALIQAPLGAGAPSYAILLPLVGEGYGDLAMLWLSRSWMRVLSLSDPPHSPDCHGRAPALGQNQRRV